MKVLLPVDGSEPSKNTVNWATTLFHTESTQFYLLVVIPKAAPELPVEEYEVEDAVKLLKTNQELLQNRGFTVLKAEYIIGDPADAICKYASDEAVDQIVIGSHGRTGIGKLLFGSVSSAVFEHAKQPVFVYKNKDAHPVSV